MICIEITDETIHALKKVLAEEVQGARSSHLFEAIARALGYRTYNALRRATASDEDPVIVQFDVEAFIDRISELSTDTLLEVPIDLEDQIISSEIPGVFENVLISIKRKTFNL